MDALGNSLSREVALMIETGIATGVVALTLTRASIFRPVRLWIKSRSEWLGELFRCPYCMSHWVAGVLVAIQWPGQWKLALIQWLVAVAVAAPTAAIVFESIVRITPVESTPVPEEIPQ